VPDSRRQVRLARRDEMPVRDVCEGGQPVVGDSVGFHRRRGEECPDATGGQEQPERREESSGAADPERPQPDGEITLPFDDQQAGDQVAAEDEEDVDAQEAAGRDPRRIVVEDDGQHGDASEAVERPNVSDRRWRARGYGATGCGPPLRASQLLRRRVVLEELVGPLQRGAPASRRVGRQHEASGSWARDHSPPGAACAHHEGARLAAPCSTAGRACHAERDEPASRSVGRSPNNRRPFSPRIAVFSAAVEVVAKAGVAPPSRRATERGQRVADEIVHVEHPRNHGRASSHRLCIRTGP